jgi:hypothetical protein
MLADPIVMKIGGTDENFVRTSITPNSGAFSFTDASGGVHTLTVKQNLSAKRNRREVRHTLDLQYTDPISGITSAQSASVYVVVDSPKAGVSADALNDMWFGLAHLLTDSSFANTTYKKVVNGEY